MSKKKFFEKTCVRFFLLEHRSPDRGLQGFDLPLPISAEQLRAIAPSRRQLIVIAFGHPRHELQLRWLSYGLQQRADIEHEGYGETAKQAIL